MIDNMREKDDGVSEVDPIVEAYKVVSRTEAGQTVLCDLLGECALFVNGFTGNSSTFFNLGRREIGLHILRRLSGQNGISKNNLKKFIFCIAEENNNDG